MDDVTVELVATKLLGALDQVAVDYVIVGSLASSFYGVSLSTQDADIVVSCKGKEVSDLVRALGDESVRDPQLAFETVTSTTKTLVSEKKSTFQIEVSYLSDDPHDQQRFSRRRKVTMYGRPAYVLTAEDVVITKINWLHLAGRAKDDSDIRAVIELQHATISWPYVQKRCDRHGTRAILDRLRSECSRH